LSNRISKDKDKDNKEKDKNNKKQRRETKDKQGETPFKGSTPRVFSMADDLEPTPLTFEDRKKQLKKRQANFRADQAYKHIQ